LELRNCQIRATNEGNGVEEEKSKMQQKKILFLLISFAIAITCSHINAQTPKRIQFAKGKSSAVVTDTTGKYGAYYLIRAKSGQKIVLDLSPATKVGIKVEINGTYGEMVLLREERGGHFEVGLEESGDYTICSINNKPVTFTLTVAITKLADI
jgi:hypothetical protein